MKLKYPTLSIVLGGGGGSSAPTAAMGWREYWDWMDITKSYSDDGTTQITADGLIYRTNGSLGVVANSQFAQTTETNRPTFKTGGAGGKSYALFDGADNSMVSLAISNFFANNAKTLVFAVTVNAGWANADFIVGDSASRVDIRIATGNTINFTNYDGVMDTSNSIAFVDGTPLIISCKHDGGKIYIRKNGGAWDAGVTSGNTDVLTGTWRLGIRGTAFTPMHLYAHAAANVVISDANLALVENYFKQQLGIS